MKNATTTLNGILDSETFNNQSRHYYLDLMKSARKRTYLKITRIDRNQDEPANRRYIIFFEDDFFFLAEGIAMLLGRYTAGQSGQNT